MQCIPFSFCLFIQSLSDSQIITHDKDFFVIDGVYDTENGDTTDIYCGMKRGTKKAFQSATRSEYKRL